MDISDCNPDDPYRPQFIQFLTPPNTAQNGWHKPTTEVTAELVYYILIDIPPTSKAFGLK